MLFILAFINIDGDWSEWSEWSPCSVTCGTGVQYRGRTCDNPPTSGNGADCKGPSRMEKKCELPACNGKFHLTIFSNYCN